MAPRPIAAAPAINLDADKVGLPRLSHPKKEESKSKVIEVKVEQ
jgi:hypothetical protein